MSQQNEPTDELNEATLLAQRVSTGASTAAAELENYLAAIEQSEGEIHAFNTVLADEARTRAADIDQRIAAGESVGPLAGVPVAVKDNLCTTGVDTTCSSKMLEGWKPPYDAAVVESLTAAGAILVGKTNLDEFAMGSSTENSAFGPTRNPADVTRVPGGSSGGSAAAVAANFAPLSLGSDTGGSIRQPASLCGVVGVKPTYGAVSRYGLIAFASSLDQIGPFAHSVTDAALLYDVIAGHDQRDSTSIPTGIPTVSDGLDAGVEGLRVGVVKELSGTTEGFEPEVARQTQAAADALAEAGAKVDEVSIPTVMAGLSAYYILAPAEASSNLARYDGVRYGLRQPGANTAAMMRASRTAGFGSEVKRRIMLGTYALSAGYYDAFYGRAQKVRTLIIEDFERAYQDFDVLLTPTSPCVAFPFDAKTDPLTMYLNDVCTIPSNLAGHPAMSVPFGTGADGLPVGVQVMAPMLGEQTMFRVGAALENAAQAITNGGA